MTDTEGVQAPAEVNICGFCGKPGADTIPHFIWMMSDGTLVHAECEDEEFRLSQRPPE